MTAPLSDLLPLRPPALLAQLGDLLAPEIPPLPDPPLAERVLFESPLLLSVLIGTLGMIVIAALLARGRGRAAAGSLVATLAGVGGGMALAGSVTTEREILRARTAELVAATAEVDLQTLRRLIHPEATVVAPMLNMFREDFPVSAILDRGALDQAFRPLGGITGHGTSGLQASVDGPSSARTQVAVSATTGSAGTRGSWWRIDWYRGAAGEPWRVRRVTALWIQGFGGGR